MNFIDIFNYVAKVARPAHTAIAKATSNDDTFQDIGLDSLDGLVMLMYLTDIYGIDEATSKEWSPTTVGEIFDLLMAHKTKEPASMEEVIEVCK
jgi:acyl carrier protein